MSAPLIDKAGRTYEQLIAAGKKILPRLNKWGVFVTRSPGRRPKTKSTMQSAETPAVPETPPSTTAENGTAGSPPATEEHVHQPSFADVDAVLKNAPVGDEPKGADALASEIRAMGDNPSAETIIGIIQTGLILIGEEEGILTDTEKALIRPPLIRVLAKYNVGKDVMPCELDLALAVLGLVIVRLKKPKTATAFAKFKLWFKNQFFSHKGRQLAAVVTREAPSQ